MAKAVKLICPMMGGEECVEDGSIRNGELVGCRFWVTVQGQNPQTGETVNNGDCAIAWTPMLLIENSKVNRETAAAVESMRNESVTTGQHLTNAILEVSKAKGLLK
tara:strand:+ start:487 stop:804 length:318 start_codon:yes stop_codon:yes gene_type:complete